MVRGGETDVWIVRAGLGDYRTPLEAEMSEDRELDYEAAYKIIREALRLGVRSFEELHECCDANQLTLDLAPHLAGFPSGHEEAVRRLDAIQTVVDFVLWRVRQRKIELRERMIAEFTDRGSSEEAARDFVERTTR